LQNAPSATTPTIDSEQQRVSQEIEAARLSRLFASTNIRELAPPPAQPPSVDTSPKVPNQTAQPTGDEAFAQNGQDRKLAFVNASVDRRTTSPDRIAAPASSHVVQAGNVIPASLMSRIRSDLPGQITAGVQRSKAFGEFIGDACHGRGSQGWNSKMVASHELATCTWSKIRPPAGFDR
jgi:type IV secretion system protein TrbI